MFKRQNTSELYNSHCSYRNKVQSHIKESQLRLQTFQNKMEEILIGAIELYPKSNYIDKMALMLKITLLKEASIPFNNANELAKKASISAPDDYVAKMELACEKFQESIPLFEKVLKYDPKNEQATDYLKICRDNIQLLNDYKAKMIKN